MCVHACTHTHMHGCMHLCLYVISQVLKLEGSLWESVCSFHSVKPRGRILVIRAGKKCLYPLCHLTNYCIQLLKGYRYVITLFPFPFSKIQNAISFNMSDKNVKNTHIFFQLFEILILLEPQFIYIHIYDYFKFISLEYTHMDVYTCTM